MLSFEIKAISASEYVRQLNDVLKNHQSACAEVTYEISGVGLEQQTVLTIPRTAIGATAEAVYQLRQDGILCYPVLAPLDLHEVS